jgi:hypothetical protein
VLNPSHYTVRGHAIQEEERRNGVAEIGKAAFVPKK